MGVAEIYHRFNIELADPRVNDWWLMSSPLLLATILFGYLYFILCYGPRYMQNRKAYTLKTFITGYNIFQIISNAWIIRNIVSAGWLTNLTLGCDPVKYSLDPMAIKIAEAFWSIFILKIIDLTETFVFVLRKKEKQVSFLHLYHHVSTPVLCWLMTKYFAGGMATLPLVVNSAVHVVMYTYYLLSASGSRLQGLVSFLKRYITIIQMVQFCFLLLHASQGLSSSCDILTSGVIVFMTNLVLNILLFSHFYRKNYTPKKKAV